MKIKMLQLNLSALEELEKLNNEGYKMTVKKECRLGEDEPSAVSIYMENEETGNTKILGGNITEIEA